MYTRGPPANLHLSKSTQRGPARSPPRLCKIGDSSDASTRDPPSTPRPFQSQTSQEVLQPYCTTWGGGKPLGTLAVSFNKILMKGWKSVGICIFKCCQSYSAALLCSCFKDKFYTAEPAADAASQEKCLDKASKRSTWQVDIFSSAGDRSTSSFSHGKGRRKVAKKVAERRKEEADPLVSDIPKRVGRKREIEAGKYDIAQGLLGCVAEGMERAKKPSPPPLSSP